MNRISTPEGTDMRRDSIPKPPDLTGKPLEIGTTSDGDSVVVSLSGELDLATAEDLAGLIRDVEETGANRIVIDLSDLAFLDSTGLAALLDAKSRSNGRLTFIPSNHDAVPRVLALTQTDEALGLQSSRLIQNARPTA